MTDDPSNPSLPNLPTDPPEDAQASAPIPPPPADADTSQPNSRAWRMALNLPLMLDAGNFRNIDAFVQIRIENHLAEGALLSRQFLGGRDYDIDVSRQRFLSIALKIFERTVRRYGNLSLKARVKELRRARSARKAPPPATDPTP